VTPGKKIYFASDLHLGFPDRASSIEREKRFVNWLDTISKDAEALFLVGDLFDFWFEYKQVIPKGYVRLFGKLAELRDSGLPIYVFSGNHDQWMFGYFEDELNIPVYNRPMEFTFNDKHFLIAHGDGLGPGDNGYKFIRYLFHSRIGRWLFARLHPNAGVWLGKRWSQNNGLLNAREKEEFLGEEKEWLIYYAKRVLEKKHIDYFIFGHRHLAFVYPINDSSKLIYLGDWISYNSYAVFDGNNVTLKFYGKE
jgi:UDP-2,3-diacylglucosamine hydrolase